MVLETSTSRSRRLAKDEKDKIDELLASAIDMDQVVLMQAELLDGSPCRVASMGSEYERLKKSAKRNAELLNSAHERLRLRERADDEIPSRDS
jgi:hypothetical protein